MSARAHIPHIFEAERRHFCVHGCDQADQALQQDAGIHSTTLTAKLVAARHSVGAR